MNCRTRTPARGARELRVRDWPFGGVGRRLLIEALLIDSQPDDGWTMGELEARALVGNGGLNTVLPGAVRLGLVTLGKDGRWHVPDKVPPIATPLRQLIVAAVALTDEVIPALAKRKYSPRSR
jgi:hypothetical protein